MLEAVACTRPLKRQAIPRLNHLLYDPFLQRGTERTKRGPINSSERSSRTGAKTSKFDPKRDYPLSSKRPDLVKTLSGRSLEDITLEGVASGKMGSQEFRIRPETLDLQARIAEAHGRMQLSLNFRRAAELSTLTDEEVFNIYDALRPRRSTEEELLQIAEELEKKYQAKLNAQLIREAARAYRMRRLLKAAETATE